MDNRRAAKRAKDNREPKARESGRDGRAKVTLYIRHDQVAAIEQIQLDQRRKTGKKPDKQDLIQEAVDLLIRAYAAK